ncbi:MAG TPA: sugar-binding protein [Cytophagaceae bacterium]|jgi:hypothetical protein
MKNLTVYSFLFLCVNAFGQNNAMINAGTPIIDGEIDKVYDMSNVLTKSLQQPQKLECPPSVVPGPPLNNIATFGLAWDFTNLYVAVKVIDASVVQGDNIELFLSLTNSRTDKCPLNWPAKYEPDDIQLLFDAKSPIVIKSPQDPQGVYAALTNSSFKKTSNGYIMELQLAWEYLEFYSDPKGDFREGRLIGFDVKNVDYDTPGTKLSEAHWNQCCFDRAWTETKNFGTATFKGITSTRDVQEVVSSLDIFPNPAKSDKITVKLTSVSSEWVEISLLNTVSKKLYSSNINLLPGANKFEFDTKELPNGVYIVLVSNGRSNKSQKFIISN